MVACLLPCSLARRYPTPTPPLCVDLASQAGCDVLGCYMSPVNDAYWKQALAPGRHRVRMCQLAAADSGGGAWA